MAAEAVGERVRRLREARQLSRSQLAGLAGLSPTWLRMLEQGLRPLERRFRAAALASALDVDVSRLSPSPSPVAVHPALPSVRAALLDLPEVPTDEEPSTAEDSDVARGQALSQVAARVRALVEAQQACRTDVVGAALPDLLRVLRERVVTGPADERDAASRLSALVVVQGAQSWLKDVGAGADLAWAAARAGEHAVADLDDAAWSGFAAFGVAHALASAGEYGRAVGVAQDALDALARRPPSRSTGRQDGPTGQIGGMLALTLAYLAAAAHRPGDIAEPLREAAEIADRTGEGNEFWFSFGPANVAIWRLLVTVEIGETSEAAWTASRTDPASIPTPSRRAAFHTEYGRALAQLRGREDTAVTELLTAENLSPYRLRTNPLVADCVADLARRRGRLGPLGDDLRGLALRMGLDATEPEQ